MQQSISATGAGPLFYRMSGEGPAIVWLHGFCESSAIWNRLIGELPGYNHILPDAAGFGNSSVPEKFDFSMRSQAALVIRLLEQLQISSAVWIGHSMGGYIALEALAQRPELVRKLVLFHSTAAPDTEERKQNRNRTIHTVATNPELFIREFYYNLFAPALKASFAPEINEFRRQAALLDPQVIIHTLEGLRDRADHREMLKAATLPRHYIIGRNDQILAAEELKAQAIASGATYTELELAGHMGFLEEPLVAQEAIADFIYE